MAINLFEGHAKEMVLAYAKQSLVASKLSNNFEFLGNKTVKVMTPTTVPMNDYSRTGVNRYGEPVEMEDTIQELTCTQDKSFALTIDKGNFEDQGYQKTARRMASYQMATRAIPEMDKYMLEKLVAGAGGSASGAMNKSNIYAAIAAGTAALDDAEAPESGRTLFINSTNYALLRQAPEFLGLEKLGSKAVGKGVVGEVDGMQVVKVPAGRWPASTNFIIVHKDAAVAPIKLDDTKIHIDPPGISGNLIEGRQYYDCFVFDAKEKGVYVHKAT